MIAIPHSIFFAFFFINAADSPKDHSTGKVRSYLN